MRHVGAVVLIAAFWVLPESARAQHFTYCVGGYGDTPWSRAACNSEDVVAEHGKCWHFHMQVSDGSRCYACYDECDATCVSKFLAGQGPNGIFHPADRFECQALGGAPADRIFRMVSNGKVVHENAQVTPPRVEVPLRGAIAFQSPGPNPVGDPVVVTVRAVDGAGKQRHAGSGEAALTLPDGSTRKIAVTPNQDGTITVTFPMPDGGHARLTVTPADIALDPGESPSGSVSPAVVDLRAKVCHLRTRITSERQGNVIIGGGPWPMRGDVVDDQHQPIGVAALKGASFQFMLESTTRPALVATGEIGADGSITGTVTPPAATGDEDLMLTLRSSGGVDLCPGPTVKLHLTSIGVALDVAGSPKKCYVGRPCAIDVAVNLPSDPRARAIAESFLNDPGLKTSFTVNGEGRTDLHRSDESLQGSFTPAFPGDLPIAIEAGAGSRSVSAEETISVRWPLKLKVAPSLDLGEIAAGTGWKRTCKPLSLAGSQGAEEQKLKLTAEMPEGCVGELLYNDAGVGELLAHGNEIEVAPGLALPICLRTKCGGGESPKGVKLRVEAVDLAFADQKATVDVQYVVTGSSWLSCNLWWLIGAAALLVAAFVTYGFIVPLDFSAERVIRMASKEASLPRALPRPLRELPGGRSGWYRSARFGLRSDGSPTTGRDAAVVFAAGRSDVVAQTRGALRRLNTRTRKLEPVEDPQAHSVMLNAVYEVDGLYFKVS